MYGKRTTRKDILDFIQMSTNCSDLVLVEDFDSTIARHICLGGKKIQLLPKQVYNLITNEGYTVNINYFFCPMCRKCIVDKNSIDLIG